MSGTFWAVVCGLKRGAQMAYGKRGEHLWRCPRWRGWIVIEDSEGAVHVYPGRDAVEHTADEECVCGPRVTIETFDDAPDGTVITHHSLDGREAVA